MTLRRLLVLVPILLGLIGMGTANATPVGTWSGHAASVQQWFAEDAALTETFFGPGIQYRMEPLRRGVGNGLIIHSLAGFKVRAPRLRDGLTVMYNPEAETVTPRWEQLHPRWAMTRFVNIARSNGLIAVLAPSRTLAKPDPKCSMLLDCGYLQIPADAFHLQAQRLECDLPAFTAFVSGAKARTRSPLIVQLTVGWVVPCVTPEAVRDAYFAALPYADGFCMWGHADPAQNAKGLEALRLISQQP